MLCLAHAACTEANILLPHKVNFNECSYCVWLLFLFRSHGTSEFTWHQPNSRPPSSYSFFVNVDVCVMLPVSLSCSLASVFSLLSQPEPTPQPDPSTYHASFTLEHSRIPAWPQPWSRVFGPWTKKGGLAKQLLQKVLLVRDSLLPITLDTNRPPALHMCSEVGELIIY